jgi:hypothetical protein
VIKQTPATEFAPGSYRDRTARVFDLGRNRIGRALAQSALTEWRAFSTSPCFEAMVERGDVIESRDVSSDDFASLELPAWAVAALEHRRVPFVSYPYEWSFGMLRDAALLQLRLLAECLNAGFIIKDASAYNTLFAGAQPLFVDVASFVRHTDGQPWAGYRQFCEMFLIPLLLQAHRGLPLQTVLRSDLEGWSPAVARRLFSFRDLFRPGVFKDVWLHGLCQQIASRGPAPAASSKSSLKFNTESIRRNVNRLTRIVERLSWSPPSTTWTTYNEAQSHVRKNYDFKSQFVDSVCRQRRRSLVWDLGCNTGTYSRIASQSSDHVVAMDQDAGCVELLYRDLKANGPANILPLTINLANASPAHGWRGRERLRLEERGRPDLVLCLGLIHHLVIGCNIPLPEFVDWLAGLGAEVVIEFPSKADPMVRQLLATRVDQYHDYSLESLKASLGERFSIVRCEDVPASERVLIHAVPESAN